VFYLNEKQKLTRLRFCEYIESQQLTGRDIFFTDESPFLFRTFLNKSTNQMRFSKKSLKKLKEGNEEQINKIYCQEKKYEEGFMVAVGISSRGVGKLIFCVGKVNSFAYKQAIDYYKEDFENLNRNLYFQQDGAKAHTYSSSMEHINASFLKKLDFWLS
jgi:hypothetical protein